MDAIHLVGAEEVSRAASRIASAADAMRSTVGGMDEALERHRRFMDDWLERLTVALDSQRFMGSGGLDV